jgi:cytochrome c556
MSEELLIKINADVKDVTKAYEDVQAKTEQLDESLSKIAKISAVAFAALTAQVALSVKEFAEADTSSRQLSNALQNQGIFTTELKDKYKAYAEEIEGLTGIQADELTKAQAVAQGHLGQIPITKELTKAIADLAVKEGVGLPEAAETLGKAIGNGTGMLLRQGLQFSATDTAADRFQKTLDFVALKAGDAATNGIAPVELSMKKLETAFKNSQQELGARFAPAVAAVADALTNFLTPAKESTGLMVDMKAIVIVLGLAISALGIGLPLAAQGFLAVRAALIAMNVQLNITRVALAGLGIGLVILALTELVFHWDAVSKRTVAIVKGMVTTISEAFGGLGKILNGAFHLDMDKVKEGFKEVAAAFKDGAHEAFGEIKKEQTTALETQNEDKKKFADKEAAQTNAHNSALKQLEKAKNEEIRMEIAGASAELLDLKKQEIAALGALAQSKNELEKQLLRQQIAEIREIENQRNQEENQRTKQFANQQAQAKADLGNKLNAEDMKLSKKELATIKSTSMTEREVRKKIYADELADKIKADNRFLEEQVKYGTAYAAINKIMHESEIQGLKSATGELTQLTQSKYAVLKNIGQVATIANIVIKTAESAMNIYAGFSAIPIIGPALGIAGAAAAIAFGAEQIDNVTAAQSGALVQGSGYGDKMPFMLEPGELVAPRQNFDEVVMGVAAQRGLKEGDEAGGTVRLELSLKDGLMDFVETKIVERRNIGISITG